LFTNTDPKRACLSHTKGPFWQDTVCTSYFDPSLPPVDLVEVDGVDEERRDRQGRGARALAPLGTHLHLQVLQVAATRPMNRVPEVCGVADHGAIDFDPGSVVAQTRLLLGLAEREALADLHEYVVAGHVVD